jgi:hypothetical protein
MENPGQIRVEINIDPNESYLRRVLCRFDHSGGDAPDMIGNAGVATYVIRPFGGAGGQVINATADMLNLVPNDFSMYAFAHACALLPSQFW